MNKRLKGLRVFSFLNPLLDRQRIVEKMEAFENLIVILLCFGLFAIMLMQLWALFTTLRLPVDFKIVTAKILFILILVELFRLLMFYLQEHSIAVSVAVEITIVSILREIIVHGALDMSWVQTASICGLLLILGVLLVLCYKKPHLEQFSAFSNTNRKISRTKAHQQKEQDLSYSPQYEEEC